ncbi:MAG: RNase P subunit p30 family protein [Methanobrevibacter sp.]|uniref:ribonuclease P protein component 3 n=1 Tax=Methanobrevibacter sp. TaxID=66852 RepID=UPI0026DF3CDB|nr:RNase P subunit p30 family protein [Methanobrevibacter sp.]MDO5849102.1 RNase P subunit p30 family protein [Methanobrevibacter sp.]
MFFDLNVKGRDLDYNIELANHSKRYGWTHINFSYSQDDFKEALEVKEELQNHFDNEIAIDYTLEIKTDNVNDIGKAVNKYRKKCNCISVVGGDLKINRASCENVRVDVLSRPYLKRYDSGLNHVLAKEAVKNNVAIELCFKDILSSYLSYRSKILSNFKDIYALHRKFGFPLILSSRAKSIFDIKSPNDIRAFFKSTGLTDEEFLKAMNSSGEILEFNRNRHNMILRGVRRIDDEA